MYFFRTGIIIFILTFSFFNQSVSQKIVKIIVDEIYSKLFLKRSCQLNSWRPSLLAEAISFSGKRSFQLKLYSFTAKPFLLVEAISSSGGLFFKWKPIFQRKPFLLMEAVSFSESRSFQSKLILLMEAIPFGENISCSENIACNGNHSIQQKLFLLVRNYSF